MECTRDAEAKIRRAAASALGRKEVSRVVGSLINAASDDEVGVRVAAIESLGSFDDNDARQILEDALQDQLVEIRRAAACALGRDYHRSDGGYGRGKNMLGRILMEVRDELRNRK